MKTLIAYFSYGGNAALVAGILKNTLNAETIEIRLLNDKKRFGPGKFLWALSQVLGNKKPAVKPCAVNFDNYDLIILGAPVWADHPSPVLMSFLDQAKLTGKKLGLYICRATETSQAMEKLRQALAGNTIAGEIEFISPKKSDPGDLKQKVEQWAKTLTA